MKPIDQSGKNVSANESGLLLDHDYDGIQELDHPLPRWWLSLFYATILFSILYAVHYMLGTGPSLREELAADMAEIEALKIVKTSAPLAGTEDEILAAIATQPEKISLGKAVFTGKCAACHGDQGQGTIGPNLTDDHWLHGTGKASEIAATVRAGVPEKGMPPWGPVLSSDELLNVTAFIVSIRGTNPPGAKEPQGTRQASY